MQNLVTNFETELELLLKQYFAEDDLSQIVLGNISLKEDNNIVSEKINDFYRNQLDINLDSFNERIKIDRTITFSEKQLDHDKLCEFLLDLGRLCKSCGKLNLANELFKKTIKSSNNTLYKAESMLELADVFSRRAEWTRCFITVSDAEKMFKEINDNNGIAKCYNLQGSVYGEQGDIEKAKSQFLKSLSLINLESDLELAANLNSNLGIIENIQERKDNSIEYLNNALLFYNKLDNQKRVAEVHYNIGMTHFESGDFDSAIAAFDEGIEIAKNGRFISILCLLYLSKSQVLIEKDDISSAAEFADKAFEISHKVDDKLTSADIYKVKGIIERRKKNFKQSESYLLNSLRINNSLNNEMNIAETSLELAALHNETNSAEYKDNFLMSALNYYKEIDATQKVKEIEAQLGLAAV
jgi:tetratricopeptide (TPR) repeat protein